MGNYQHNGNTLFKGTFQQSPALDKAVILHNRCRPKNIPGRTEAWVKAGLKVKRMIFSHVIPYIVVRIIPDT
jgi:hypothetical protein